MPHLPKKNLFLLVGVLVILLALPVAISLVQQRQIIEKKAAVPPKLEYHAMVWPSGTSQFPQLRDWGINLVWMVMGFDQNEWERIYEEAITNEIKIHAILLAGDDTVWTVDFEQGRPFLNWLKNNPRYLEATFALWGSNEPWMSSGISPEGLKNVYQKIKAEIPSLKVYCAGCIDHPDYRGGGMYDYTLAGGFPFGQGRQDYESSLKEIDDAYELIMNDYKGLGNVELVFKAQTFKSPVYPWDRFPSLEELRELARLVLDPASLHSGKVAVFAWYPWAGGPYDDYLANHPEIYNVLIREVTNNYFLGLPTPTFPLTPTPTSVPTPPISPTPTPGGPTPTPPAHCLPLGDIDCSGKINSLDFSYLIAHYNTSDSKADLDDSGKVNALDVSVLLSNFGQEPGVSPTPSPTPTPTPTPPSGGMTNIYWGDLHHHDNNGVNAVNEAKANGCDFCSVFHYDSHMSNSVWQSYLDIATDYTDEGEGGFLVFPGFEATAVSGGGADDIGVYVRRSEDASRTWVDPGDYEELKTWQDINHAISIKAHPTTSTEWIYPKEYTPSAEIINGYMVRTYQRSEESGTYGFSNAWKNLGVKMGVVGVSDWYYTACGGPLTACHANSLTRENIFNGLKNRGCYATSGEKIELWFDVDGHQMGSEFSSAIAPTVNVVVKGTANILKIEVIKNEAVIFSKTDCNSLNCSLTYTDNNFAQDSYYRIRVSENKNTPYPITDVGSKETAWSSPIWVNKM